MSDLLLNLLSVTENLIPYQASGFLQLNYAVQLFLHITLPNWNLPDDSSNRALIQLWFIAMF
jgi:hypothetical protein